MTEPAHIPTAMRDLAWSDGEWINPPVSVIEGADGSLRAEAAEGSDAWRTTSYGFIRDSAHGLLRPFATDGALEVDFVADMSEQFDQAGLLIRAGEEQWIKAGIEFADGVPRLSAVVTDRVSDWSTAPVPEWLGRRVTVRASWSGDAVSVRAKVDGGDFELVRLAPWAPAAGAPVAAGPFLAAPSRGGFTAAFTGWRVGPPDAALH